VGLWHVVTVGRRVCSPAGITRVCCGEKARRHGNQVELVKALSERNCDWLVFGKEGDFERSEGADSGIKLCSCRHFWSVVNSNVGKSRYLRFVTLPSLVCLSFLTFAVAITSYISTA